jgi:hypothetical protein
MLYVSEKINLLTKLNILDPLGTVGIKHYFSIDFLKLFKIGYKLLNASYISSLVLAPFYLTVKNV